MNYIEILLIAVGLSMDAFAVSISLGLAMKKASVKNMLIVGGYFGGFQAVMPILGYLAATFFADLIISYDHWVAFILLSFLGGKMVFGSLKKVEIEEKEEKEEKAEKAAKAMKAESCSKNHSSKDNASLRPGQMLTLSLATSIDALAVGVSFAFLRVSIIRAASIIGLTTLVISMLGVKTGTLFGAKIQSRAEFAGGLILILIGLKILLEHMNVISF